MIPERIKNIDISNKSLLSILHGKVDDVFIAQNTIKYSIEAILYLYLKNEGFDSVIFYSNTDFFYSYSQQDLIIFLTDEKSLTIESNRQHISERQSKKSGPLGRSISSNEQQVSPKVESFGSNITISKRLDRTIYKSPPSISVYSGLYNALNKTKSKIAIIINQAMVAGANKHTIDSSFFSDPQLNSFLIDSLINQHSLTQNHRIIFNYGTQETFKEGDLPVQIMNQIFITAKDEKNDANECFIKVESDIYIELPYQDEIQNILLKKYFSGLLPNLFNLDIDKITQHFVMDETAISQLLNKNVQNDIGKISMISAWDKLSEMKGLMDFKEKLQIHINKIKKARNNGNNRVHPHIIIKGPPGVGKTHVARILAEILKEEGIIKKGGFHEGSTSDLIGEYVGHSAPKTQRLFKQNKGNVLFIDEIYDLKPDGGDNDVFKNEAVKQMLTEMDYPDWKNQSVFICAGYKNDVDDFLRKTNVGFTRRIGIQLEIDHYSPEILYEILIKNIEEGNAKVTNQEVVNKLKLIIQRLYSLKNKMWGNAGEMEKIATDITTNVDETQEVKLEDIPKELLKLVDVDNSSSSCLQLLKNMTGLNGVKNNISELYARLSYTQELSKRTGKSASEPLTFVFTGNPGTGKTTIARILGNILFDLGLLKSPDVEEVNYDNMRFASQVIEAFDKSLGKVLFIDEAYQINSLEAINTLVQNLTSIDYDGKLAVVIAGYTKKINSWLESNDGLKSRFANFILFEDYSELELYKILLGMLQKQELVLDEKSRDIAISNFKSVKLRDSNKFGNARYLEKELIPILKSNISKRLLSSGRKFTEIDDEELKLIISQDFPNYGLKENEYINLSQALTEKSLEIEKIYSVDSEEATSPDPEPPNKEIKEEPKFSDKFDDFNYDYIFFDLDNFLNIDKPSIDKRMTPSLNTILSICEERNQKVLILERQFDDFKDIHHSYLSEDQKNLLNTARKIIKKSKFIEFI